MLTPELFKGLLEVRGALVLDGGLATEFEHRGYDLNHPLWSAKLLDEDPMVIKQVHLDYYIAGADVAITASYQASAQGLLAHFGLDEEQSTAIIKRSATLARLALEESYGQGVRHDKPLLVAGSVGPYGAYLADGSEYRGDYGLTSTELKAFHRPRIKALSEADVDLLAIETMPKLEEINSVLELLREEFPGTIAWISCTLKDSSHLSNGTALEDVLKIVHNYPDIVVAFGVNCVPPVLAVESLKQLKSLTDLPLVCYPNSGESFDGETKQWSRADVGDDPHATGRRAQDWRAAGAKLIGGCCRIGPREIMAISRVLNT